jgi:putative ABC transport system substrate-binding protein
VPAKIRRWELIAALGGVVWSFAVCAQQSERLRRIGVLTNLAENDEDTQSWISVLRQELHTLGWREDQNIRMDVRWGGGDLARLRSYAAELVSLMSDVIFADSTPSIAALKAETRTIPIVFVGGSNPIGSGFAESLAHPGGNITGFISFEPNMGGKWLETLKELAPGVVHVGLIYNPQTHTGQYFDSIETAARSLAVRLVRHPFAQAANIEHGIGETAREPNSGLLVLSDPSAQLHRDLIITLAERHRLPAIYPNRSFVTHGGLLSYGVDRRDQYQRAAHYISRILKGQKPADLPIQTPTKFELVVNLKTVKLLGLQVPPAMLVRADEIIE